MCESKCPSLPLVSIRGFLSHDSDEGRLQPRKPPTRWWDTLDQKGEDSMPKKTWTTPIHALRTIVVDTDEETPP